MKRKEWKNPYKEFRCKHCGTTDENKFKGTAKSICKYCNDTIYKRNKKVFAVNYKGGKCEKCGYDRCIASLDFHHLDPNEKEYNLSSIMNWSKERIKKELDKCILLCSNCHREEHDRLRNSRYLIPLTTKYDKVKN